VSRMIILPASASSFSLCPSNIYPYYRFGCVHSSFSTEPSQLLQPPPIFLFLSTCDPIWNHYQVPYIDIMGSTARCYATQLQEPWLLNSDNIKHIEMWTEFRSNSNKPVKILLL
jgi:hypothetical protein